MTSSPQEDAAIAVRRHGHAWRRCVPFVVLLLLTVCVDPTTAQNNRRPIRPTRTQTGSNNCNVLDPNCRRAIDANNQNNRNRQPDLVRPTNQCNYQDLYLIPTKADSTCTRPDARRVLDIDPSSVVIYPSVIKLPGCFIVEFQNVRLREKAFQLREQGFFGKAEYQWWNLKEFSELKCQNASSDGCGGYGNNCFYCDICQSLSELKNNSRSGGPPTNNRQQSDLVDQFRGLNCPDRPGVYTFRKQFCFNDWKAFDEDGDCQFDFLKGGNNAANDYRQALKSLRQIGYGTMIAKFKLSHNATQDQLVKKQMKEREIEQIVDAEMEKRRANWSVSSGRFDQFRSWYTTYKKDAWHKNKYLPWLIFQNEVACVKVTFNVCDREPTPINIPPHLHGTYRGPKYQCAAARPAPPPFRG